MNSFLCLFQKQTKIAINTKNTKFGRGEAGWGEWGTKCSVEEITMYFRNSSNLIKLVLFPRLFLERNKINLLNVLIIIGSYIKKKQHSNLRADVFFFLYWIWVGDSSRFLQGVVPYRKERNLSLFPSVAAFFLFPCSFLFQKHLSCT